MKKKGTILIVFFLIATLCCGCANLQTEQGQGAAGGAAIGATIGAVIGGIIGGEKWALIGAGIGAAVGGATGYAYGNHVAHQKAKYASEEDWLDACVTEAQWANLDLSIYNKGLAQQVTDAEKEIVALKKKQKNAKTRQAKLQEKQVEVSQMLTSNNNKLERAKKELEAQQYVTGEATKSQKSDHATTMNGEVEDLKANIAELEKRTKALASLSASMAV